MAAGASDLPFPSSSADLTRLLDEADMLKRSVLTKNPTALYDEKVAFICRGQSALQKAFVDVTPTDALMERCYEALALAGESQPTKDQ